MGFTKVFGGGVDLNQAQAGFYCNGAVIARRPYGTASKIQSEQRSPEVLDR